MTGTRFGEATPLTVADVELLSKPLTALINKAWERDGQKQFYVGATKTGGKRTIGLNPAAAIASIWWAPFSGTFTGGRPFRSCRQARSGHEPEKPATWDCPPVLLTP